LPTNRPLAAARRVTVDGAFLCIIVAVRTLFLTGGTGFVGSHVAQEFLARGWNVRALVRRPERARLLPPGVEPVRADLLDPAHYRSDLRGCAAVVHCAGATRALSLAEFRRTNVSGAEAVARAASESCPDAMFVYVSSQAAAGPSRTGAPVRESDASAPVSWYGRSKLEGELTVARHHLGRWCVVRPSVVYGAGDPGLIAMFRVVARGVAPLLAGSRRRVQLLAAEDLARILFATAQRPDLHGRRAFAAGDTVSVEELVRAVAALRTPRARVIAVPGPAVRVLGVLASLQGALTRTASAFNLDKVKEMLQPDWLCDSEPFLRDLQVTTAIPWQEGIRHTCRWYVHARWLAPTAFAGV
jgi:nucleoside-diphosphate-sugar epimerase